MLLTLLAGNLTVAPPLPARGPSAYYAEIEPFIREQRANLTGALYTTYYSASDLTIFARRQQDTWESELFDRPQPNLASTSFQPVPPVTTGSEFLIRIRRRGRR